MKRKIVKINESKCDGCGLCIPACHEGALQIIDGKARLISDLLCDGLGACIGHCPKGAITIEEREAEPYNEIKTIQQMIEKGTNTVVAHLKHLLEHNEVDYFKEGINYLYANQDKINFDVDEILNKVHENKNTDEESIGCGCIGTLARDINKANNHANTNNFKTNLDKSELTQWPIQLHLVNPSASYFKNADLIVSADCVAYATGNFHQEYLKGKKLVIACPKLDKGIQIYIEKIQKLIDTTQINTITVMIMEVPCCKGLLQMVLSALSKTQRKVPVKLIIISVEGEVLQNTWL